MATTDVKTTSLASTFHALSDPMRLRILGLLMGGERCVCELTESLSAGQSRLSFHLKVLKEAGLVSDRREGRWVYYTLVAAPMEEAAEYLGSAQPAVRTWPLLRGKRRDATACCD